MVSGTPSISTKFLGRLYFFPTVLQTEITFLPECISISSANNFLTTGCIEVIDASGSSFELSVKETFLFKVFEYLKG